VGATEALGMIVSIVEVGRVVEGTLVGSGVGVNAIIGDSRAVQAVRRNKERAMSFFIQSNYMSLRVFEKQSPI
jgi:hypothetical protein